MGAASILYSSDQQPAYASKQQTRTLRKNNPAQLSKPSTKFTATATRNIYGNFLIRPQPYMSLSYPPSASLYNYMVTQNHQYINSFGHQQPPLLPSPPHIATSYNSLPSLTRNISCPPLTRKTTKPKKQKPVKKHDKSNQNGLAVSKGKIPSGPDPNELPIRALSLSQKTNKKFVTDMDMFSGAVFATSPPPSSLPLPKFTVIRPKLGCKAEAARVNDGATDNLRRILRL